MIVDICHEHGLRRNACSLPALPVKSIKNDFSSEHVRSLMRSFPVVDDQLNYFDMTYAVVSNLRNCRQRRQNVMRLRNANLSPGPIGRHSQSGLSTLLNTAKSAAIFCLLSCSKTQR